MHTARLSSRKFVSRRTHGNTLLARATEEVRQDDLVDDSCTFQEELDDWDRFVNGSASGEHTYGDDYGESDS